MDFWLNNNDNTALSDKSASPSKDNSPLPGYTPPAQPTPEKHVALNLSEDDSLKNSDEVSGLCSCQEGVGFTVH